MLFPGKMMNPDQGNGPAAVTIMTRTPRGVYGRRSEEAAQETDQADIATEKHEPINIGKRFAGCIFLRPVV